MFWDGSEHYLVSFNLEHIRIWKCLMNSEPVLSAILLVLLHEVAVSWYTQIYQVELLPSDMQICSFDEVAAYWYMLSYEVSIKWHRQTCSFDEFDAKWYMQCSIKLLTKYQVLLLNEVRWVIRQCSMSLFCSLGVSFSSWACPVLNLVCAVQLSRCTFPC